MGREEMGFISTDDPDCDAPSESSLEEESESESSSEGVELDESESDSDSDEVTSEDDSVPGEGGERDSGGGFGSKTPSPRS